MIFPLSALAFDFDPGDGGVPPRYFETNSQYFSNLFCETFGESYDSMVISSTSCFDGLEDVHGHFDYIDKIYLNLQVSLDPDLDYCRRSWWYSEEYYIKIDYVKVSIKIQNPIGEYLSESMVAGLTQYKCTGGGNENTFMIVLYDVAAEFTSGILPYPLSATLKSITNNVPNPFVNKYQDGSDSSDPNKHWWKFDYGTLFGEDELGLQIIFSPTFGIYKGYYIITFEYEVHLKKLGRWWTGSFPGSIGGPFEDSWLTYTTQHSLIVIKDIGNNP